MQFSNPESLVIQYLFQASNCDILYNTKIKNQKTD